MAILFYEQWYDVFSNFSALAVEFEGALYPTAEHAYQAAKCTDPAGKQAILRAKSPAEAKDIANLAYQAAKHPQWDQIKVGVLENILRAKLAQHDTVRQALMRSGKEDIGEASPDDMFWGYGDGQGQNQLGKLWMKLRSELVVS